MTFPLARWDDELRRSFSTLRRESDQFRSYRPLFALEHGLDPDSELPELSEAVRRSVADGRLPSGLWLPYVVYAAEVGYRYRGDKYWPVFAEETPGWKELGDPAKKYIKTAFEKFADEFGGARPSGVFHETFGRISWPITHAVLPSDLQTHLARLLYEGRGMLKPELLRNHQELGERLAGRANNTPGRFQTFAKNFSLLGLVAAGLLSEDEETGLLRRSTLDRISKDLQEERQAGRWLKGAKQAAQQARLRGLAGDRRGGPAAEVADRQDHFQWPVPELTVRSNGGHWEAYISLPDHGHMALWSPDLKSELEMIRCRIRGVERKQARGSLMYQIGPLRLSEFPSVGESVLEPENPSEDLKRLLTDSCRFPDAPWLFRLRESGFGTQRRTRHVRPGDEYMLLTRPGDSTDSTLCVPVTISTSEVDAYLFTVPDPVDDATKQTLEDLGLGVAPDLYVWPAGLVPAGWDGEDRASWLEGEDPIIGIYSSSAAAQCVVATDRYSEEFPWPPESGALFVKLTELRRGVHPISITLRSTDGRPLLECPFEIRISDPPDSLANVGARQGLRMASYPANPALMDIWNGDACIVAYGPHDERVKFTVDLIDSRSRSPLARARFSSLLPMDEARWRDLFRGVKGDQLSRHLGQAEELLVSISGKGLGSTQIQAIRPFRPLRWITDRDRDGPYAELINLGDDNPEVDCYETGHADRNNRTELDGDDRVRIPNGGLVVARAGNTEAAVILSPHIEGDLTALRTLRIRPRFGRRRRTSQDVGGLIDLARLWTRTADAMDSTARQTQDTVNNAIVAELGKMIAGEGWWQIEVKIFNGGSPAEDEMTNALRTRAGRVAAADLFGLSQDAPSESEERLAMLSGALGRAHAEFGFPPNCADFILRLATQPGSLPTEFDLLKPQISFVLDNPESYRLARLFAIAVARHENPTGAKPSLWSWPWP